MLIDRGLLEQVEDEYRPTGPIEALEVPETLQALIAARLDGLPAEERSVVQDAAVLGKTFSKAALAAVSGSGDGDLDALLTALVRKEVLSLQVDPRSPERGQYSFLQDLLRQVAYETLPRKERRVKHLAAAAHLEQRWQDGDEELVEIVAAHVLSALQLDPEAGDAGELRKRVEGLLVRAAERAASLGASENAQRYVEQALELSESPLRRAELHERAGELARLARNADSARAHFEQAIALLRGAAAHRIRLRASPPGWASSPGSSRATSSELSPTWSGRSRCWRVTSATAISPQWRYSLRGRSTSAASSTMRWSATSLPWRSRRSSSYPTCSRTA